MSESDKKLNCSFCTKNAKEVKKLIAGPNVYICDECVDLCYSILSTDSEGGIRENATPGDTADLGAIPSPSKIKEFMDQYIIGQDYAKMVISVAVHNHYMRLAHPVVDDVEIDKSNILIFGPTGSGKCLHSSTPMQVRVTDELHTVLRHLEFSHQSLHLEPGKLVEINVKIGDLFQAISQLENHDFQPMVEYQQTSTIQIKNENNDWCQVPALIVKNGNIHKLVFSNGSELQCAGEHWIRTLGQTCVYAKNLLVGDQVTDSQGQVLVCMENLDTRTQQPVYDLQIDTPSHLYQTANGLVHHNTLIAQTIARFLDVPFAMADATSLTEAGYVGSDVESIVSKLLQAADGDVKKCERGIIYLDEIDKKQKKESGSGNKDVSGEGVQQALLKIIEGSEIMVPASSGKKNAQADMVKINTKNILFIVGGAFVGLEKVVEKSLNKNASLGFNGVLADKSKKINEILRHAMPEHLIQFGIIPELIGRLPVQAPLEELSEQQLVRVLTEPKNAVIKQFIKMFKMEGLILEFTEPALLQVAKLSKDRKTGARGLRSVIENKLVTTQFKLPDLKAQGAERIIVTLETITEDKEPTIIFGENKQSVV